jgi:hypothetical protein
VDLVLFLEAQSVGGDAYVRDVHWHPSNELGEKMVQNFTVWWLQDGCSIQGLTYPRCFPHGWNGA